MQSGCNINNSSFSSSSSCGDQRWTGRSHSSKSSAPADTSTKFLRAQPRAQVLRTELHHLLHQRVPPYCFRG